MEVLDFRNIIGIKESLDQENEKTSDRLGENIYLSDKGLKSQ